MNDERSSILPEEILGKIQKEPRDTGFLISFEGLDGSGKSTQFKIFRHWLAVQGYDVVTTKWKSSPLLAPYIKARKETKSLSPEEFSLLHLADFFLRLESLIVPALQEGKVVLCDRYIYTSLSRDTVRGIDAAWLLSVYQPAVWPDLAFYFSVSPETSLRRIVGKREPKYYEAGQDMTKIVDASESYRIFGKKILEKYEAMADQFDFIRVDAERPIEVQQQYIRRIFREAIARACAPSDAASTGKSFSRVNVP
jgi:dTMP kinase